MKSLVSQLAATCDVVIVSMHCGGEGVAYEHVTRKADYYIEQNRGNAYEFAHLAIDAGADVVLGHGPHVTRGVEIYNGKFIAYSMGNFATYSQIKIAGKLGIAPIFRIRMDAKTGDFIDAQVISTYQVNPNKGPLIDKKNQALKSIKSLSATDFYDNPPTISDDGWITK
jgi:poly-gamma-glutamate capsule biosynthesis protein CapA/YwtB (metallophosphatase superfamily)